MGTLSQDCSFLMSTCQAVWMEELLIYPVVFWNNENVIISFLSAHSDQDWSFFEAEGEAVTPGIFIPFCKDGDHKVSGYEH